MVRSAIILLLTTQLTGFAQLRNFPNRLEISDQHGQPAKNSIDYWPVDIFKDSVNRWPLMDSGTVKYCSRILFEMNEPVLTNYNLNKDVIRLTWIRSFDPEIVVRFEKSADGLILIQKKFERLKKIKTGKKSFRWPKPGEVSRTYAINLVERIDNEMWEKLTQIIQENNFEKIPTNSIAGPDGSAWIIEVHTANGWYVAAKHAPDENDEPEFIKIGNFILDNSKFSDEERY